MTERPIIMSGNHLGLILDGTKTQTRRVISLDEPIGNDVSLYLSKGYLSAIHPKNFRGWFYVCDKKGKKVKCPYGQVGDRLWVRENFIYGGGDYDNRTCYIRYAVDNVEVKYKIPDGYSWDKTCKWCYTKLDGSHPVRPSIHMPRWASRILLEITDIRVERLQEMTLGDVKAEGMTTREGQNIVYGLFDNFQALWDSLNAKRGYSWETNPWVWCLSFRRLE